MRVTVVLKSGERKEFDESVVIYEGVFAIIKTDYYSTAFPAADITEIRTESRRPW